jgi:hypothetical protein
VLFADHNEHHRRRSRFMDIARPIGIVGIERDPPPVDPSMGQSERLAACEGRFDYLLVESTGIWISEPLPAAEPRLGRRTALTLPLLPPPQKN